MLATQMTLCSDMLSQKTDYLFAFCLVYLSGAVDMTEPEVKKSLAELTSTNLGIDEEKLVQVPLTCMPFI